LSPLTRYGYAHAISGFFEFPTDNARRILPRHLELLTRINGGRAPKPSVQENGTVQLRLTRRPLARFFEETVKLFPQPKTVSNWLGGDLTAYIKAEGKEIEDLPITPRHLADLLRMVEQGTISGRTAKEILPEMLASGARPDAIVGAKGLSQISDTEALERVVGEVIAEHAGPVADVRAGKTQALTFLVGQVMKKTRGRANPELANRLLRERLGLRG